jgi:uncharacterized protein YjaZ
VARYGEAMVEPCELVVGNTPRTRRVARVLDEPFQRARDLCAARLGAADIEVHVVDAPEECIPEMGLGGYAYGPHAIVLAVDPDHTIQPSDVLSTLVHEIHHAVRWRGPGCGSSLGERLVSEGLAQVFEYECTGRVPIYAQGEVRPADRAVAIAAIDEDPANEGRWFFGAGDLPRWFGYRFGYELASQVIESRESDAASLVLEPVETFVSSFRS